MNRSIVLVTAIAALGLAACTSTSAPENNAATTPSTPSSEPLPPVAPRW